VQGKSASIEKHVKCVPQTGQEPAITIYRTAKSPACDPSDSLEQGIIFLTHEFADRFWAPLIRVSYAMAYTKVAGRTVVQGLDVRHVMKESFRSYGQNETNVVASIRQHRTKNIHTMQATGIRTSFSYAYTLILSVQCFWSVLIIKYLVQY